MVLGCSSEEGAKDATQYIRPIEDITLFYQFTDRELNPTGDIREVTYKTTKGGFSEHSIIKTNGREIPHDYNYLISDESIQKSDRPMLGGPRVRTMKRYVSVGDKLFEDGLITSLSEHVSFNGVDYQSCIKTEWHTEKLKSSSFYCKGVGHVGDIGTIGGMALRPE